MKRTNFTFARRYAALCTLVATCLAPGVSKGQVVFNGGASNQYMLGSNWTGGSIPGSTAVAQYGSVGTSTTQLILMNSSNNNGTANQAVGAIDMTSGRTILLQIGSTNQNGTLTLNGATVNSISNVVLSNSNSSANLSFPTSSPSLRFSIPGSSNRNFITAGGTSSTLIGCTISMIDTITSTAPFTFLGGGTWDGSSGNAGGLWKLTGGGQNFSGGVTVGKSDGTQCGVFEIDAVNTLLNTSGNNVTVNPNSELYLNSATGTFNTSNITLTLKGNGNPVTLTSPGGALVTKSSTSYTWTGPIVLAADATISTINTGTLTLSGNITGSGKLIKNGVTSQLGTVQVSGTSNSWGGGTEIQTGNMIVASGSSISTGALSFTNVTTSIGGNITFNNTAQTISSLSNSFVPTSGTQANNVVLASGHTLTLNQSSNTTYGNTGTVTSQTGIISGAGAMIKDGSGTLTLTSSGTYFTGGLTINSGEIRFNPATNTNITFNSPVTLNGGTLSTTSTSSTANITFNTLTLAANSTIDLGTAATHSVKFANSSATSWTGSTRLNVTGWQGSFNGTSGTSGKLFIGTTSSGATAGQLAQIQFTDGSGRVYPAAILSTGEIVAKASITTTAASYGPYSNASANTISVPFTTSSGTFSGNFRVQLSNASGTFTADTTTGVIGTGSSSPISATIPAATTPGAAYRVRVINGSPYTIFGTDNGSNISILTPRPTVTSVTPNTGIPGSSVTITGTNFNTSTGSNIVYFGSTRASVTSATATSLTVNVPADAVYAPVTVLNTGLDLMGAERLYFNPTYTTTNLTSGEINFSAYQSFSTGSAPFTGILGDIDGDGKSDMISINSGGSNLTIYRNISTSGSITAGSFGSPITLGTAASPINVRFADVDGDGKGDLIVTSAATAGIGVFRNTSSSGSISFASRVDFSTTASGLVPVEVTIADFDGDGRPDMAASASFSNTIVVFQNASTPGTVSFGTGVAFAANTGAFGITSADLDGDGKVDIAVVDTGSASVSVFRNTSAPGIINSGSFATAVDFATGSTPIDIEAADIDGDGKLDMVISNSSSNSISVLRNTSSAGSITSGSFATKVDFTVGTNPSGIAIGDIDGDGKPDIATANSASSSVSVFRNISSSGSFTTGSLDTRIDLTAPGGPQGLSIGDVDGDGKPDIVAASAGTDVLAVFRNYRLPNVAAITGTTTLCTGTTTTLANATSGGTWSLTDNSIATIDASGVVTGVSAGADTAMYTVLVSGDATIVYAPLTINASSFAGSITGASTVCVGATTTYADTVSGGSWSSSDNSLATVDASGVVTGVSAGSVTITYSVTGACGTGATTRHLTVNPAPNAGTFSGATSVCTGANTTLVASGTSGGSFTSSDAGVATVNTGGSVRGVAAGSVTISYSVTNSCGTDVTTQAMTVNASPDAGTISAVSIMCATGAVTATTTGTGGSWSSSDNSLATVDAGGNVYAITAGSITVSYTVTNGCGTDVATHNITIRALPDAGTISGATSVCTGANTTLSTTGTGGTWSSSSTSNATVNSSGLVHGVATGSATISYSVTNSCGTDVATQSMTINTAADAGVVSGSSTVCATASITYATTATGGSWSTSNSSVASVDASGVVTGIAGGSATISYSVTTSCGTDFATRNITVNPAPDAGTFSGASSVCVGANTTLTASGTSGGTFSSSDGGVATVNTGGSVHGVSAGSVTISYSVTNVCGTDITTQAMTVIGVPDAGTISGASSVCTGAATTLSTTGTGGTWSSSNSSLATVSTGGVVSGLLAGSVTISYSVTTGCGTDVATSAFTVNASPYIDTIAGPSIVATSGTVTLTDAASGGAWTSSTPSIATVSATGVVTGVTPGYDTIRYTVTTACGSSSVSKVIAVSSAPIFTGGSVQNIYVCSNWVLSTINPFLKVYQAFTGLTVRWTLVSVGSGTAVASYSTTSTGGVLTPVGLGYTPAPGFSGYDTVIVRASNGIDSSTCTLIVRVEALPAVPTVTGTSSICVGGTAALSGIPSGGTWNSSASSIFSYTSGGVVTGVHGGTGTINYRVYNSIGCWSQASYAVTVNTPGALPGFSGGTALSSVCPGATFTLTHSIPGGVWTSSNTSIATVASGTITGVTPGNDTIYYTVTNACGSVYARWPFRVIGVPSVSSITGYTASLCPGSSVTLNNATAGGVWSSSTASIATITAGGGVVTAVSGGLDTVRYSVTNSCGLTGVATKLINVLPTPNAGTISGPSTVVNGSTITLSTTGTGGLWSSTSTTLATVNSAGLVRGRAVGTDTIKYTVTNACGTSIARQVITITASRGAEENGSGTTITNDVAGINLYPNPTNGIVNLVLSGNAAEATIMVSDISGKVMVTRTTTDKSLEIDMSNVAAGTYLVRVNMGGKVFNEKVMVQ